MRVMLRVTIPVEYGNAAIKDGSLAKIIGGVIEKTKAEAAYFSTYQGKRSGYIFFEMNDSSEMPSIAEKLFEELHAEIDFQPVMNVNDLQKGLTAVM